MLFIFRPTLKGMVRQGNNVLQICKQLAAANNFHEDESTENLTQMREAMGVLQHHDAVSGTAKQAVTFDYAERLHSGVLACEKVISKASTKFVPPINSKPEFCHLLNISQCQVTEENDRFLVNVYNPLSREISRPIRLPVKMGAYIVSKLDEAKNMTIQSQLVPIPKTIYLIPGRNSHATHELVFMAIKLPPMGHQIYHIEKTNGRSLPEQLSSSFLVSHFRASR